MRKLDFKNIVIVIIIVAPFVIFSIFELSPFVDSVVTIFFYLAVLIYVLGIYMLLKPMLKVKKQLNQALSQISSESNFFEISKIVKQYTILEKPLFEFKKSLRNMKQIEEDTGDSKSLYYATVDAEVYFNEGTLIYNNISNKTLNFLPQVLTGIGIFGTFLGIIQGISGLGNEMGSEEIQSAITKLLSGVEVSFRTSLYGIAFSITLTILIKVVFDIVLAKIYILNGYIDGSLRKSIENEGLKELEKQLEKQTSSIERLATDISQELGNKIDISLNETMDKVSENINQMILEMQKNFESSVVKNISSTLEKLVKISDELVHRQEKSSDQFMKDTINRIEKVISMGTQNEIEKLKGSLEQMTEKNNQYILKFTKAIENIERLFDSQKDLIKGTNSSVENINLTSQNIKDLQNGLSNLVVDINNISVKNNQSVEDIGQMFDKIKSFSFEQGTIIENLSNMIDKTYEYSKMQENYMYGLHESAQLIDNSINNSKGYINNMTNELKVYLDNFRTLKTMSFEITDKFNDNFTDIILKLEQTSTRLNESIEKVNDDIIKNVHDATKEIASVSKELNVFYNNINQLSSKIEEFAKVEGATQEMWKTYRESFDELNKNINEGITNYTEAIKRGTYDVFEQYDDRIAEAVKHLKGMVESIHEELEKIVDVFEENT